MDLLQLFDVLLLGTALVLSLLSGTCRSQENTCTVMACGNPGLNGLPGRDGKDGAKGEKGDPGIIFWAMYSRRDMRKGVPPAIHDCIAGGTQAMVMVCNDFSSPPVGYGCIAFPCQAVNDIQRQVTALEKNIQTLQADLSKHKKVLLMQGAMSVGGKTFVSTGQYHTFSGGKVLCEKAGGALATPRNVAENTALKDIVKRKSEYAFLAINDIQTEGRFVYLDGTPVNYKNWNRGEPNDLDNEDCAILHEDGLWNDIDCARKALIICEI
ncbi:Mannose-binding protein [Varanus komodoensis]|nr:Mannose-binding protein [Varanus komodoensis]